MQYIYRRSIVWDYFIAGRKHFSALPILTSGKTSARRQAQAAEEECG
jgi:hypothetical protein